MSKFKVGDKVYWVYNVEYLFPYIIEFTVAKQTLEDKKMSLITLAPASHPDSPSLRESHSRKELSHTMAGATILLDNAIDERILKYQAAIEKLRAIPVGNREAVNFERGFDS